MIDHLANILAIKGNSALGRPIYDTDYRALVRVVLEEMRDNPPPAAIRMLALINADPELSFAPEQPPADWLREAWADLIDVCLLR
jgi:hypothetical protein